MRHYITAALLMAPLLSQASALQVSPTTVTLKPGGKAQQVWLSATGEQPVSGQVRVYRWEQHNGQDVLTETRDVVASPPVMSVPPGQTQLVRLIGKQPAGRQEQAFRLIVNQLPEAPTGQPKSGVQFLLKYSVPVFLPPAGAKTDKTAQDLKGVTFSLKQDQGHAWLVANNTRNTHIRLSELEFVTAAGQTQRLQPGLLGYVLAGQTAKWEVKTPSASGYFRAIVSDGTVPENLLSWSL